MAQSRPHERSYFRTLLDSNRPQALLALADALDAVEPLDPAVSRQNERAHQFARATVGVFWQRLDSYRSGPVRDIAIGQASALSGDEGLLGIDLKPLAQNWRILALCEIELGVEVGIEQRSLAKQSGPMLASVEMFIAMARYAHAVAGSDLADALELGILAVKSYSIVLKSKSGKISPDSGQVVHGLIQEELGDVLKTVPVDLLIWRRFRGVWGTNLASRINDACAAAWGDVAPIKDVIAAASGAAVTGMPSPSVALAASLASMPNLKGNPRARFERDLLLISHAAHSLARRLLEPVIVSIVAEGWATVLNDESFALYSPMQSSPSMTAAIEDMKGSGLSAAARLILAAAPAVKVSLSETWRQVFITLAGGETIARP